MNVLSRTGLFRFLLSLTVAAVASQSSPSQITIQKQHVLNIFGAGGSHRYSEGIEGNINIGKTGGPNVYDFTAFNLTTLGMSYNYEASTIPALAARYPSAAVSMGDSPTTIEKNPVFLFATDTAFVLGEASLVPTMRFKHHVPWEIMMVFPASFGATLSQTITEYDTTFTSGGDVSAVNVSTSLEMTTIDGYGTLKLAGREYNCLRMKKEHTGYGDKEFIYMTQEGALVLIAGIPLSSPDTGLVPAGGQVLLASSIAAVNENSQMPADVALDQNYPNPFNPRTDIGFRMTEAGPTRLQVHDLLGRLVATLVNEHLSPGVYRAAFDAAGLPSGIYIARLQAGGATRAVKMVLAR